MIKSVYKTGSSLVLSNPNDVDYIYYCETKEERKKELRKNHDHSVDNHYRLWGSEPKIFLGCYIYPYMELVSGEKIPEFNTFNICEHKQEYCEYARFYIENMKNEDKRWYHIYAVYLMFKKNYPSLTKQEWTEVQEIHDNGITPALKEKIMEEML